MSLVIFAWGNPGRGDDGLGPALARRIENLLEMHLWRDDIVLVEGFQLQVEHAMDLENRDIALFIDASATCDPPFSFAMPKRIRETYHTSHALSPGALLHVFYEIHAREAPPSFLLSIRGERFGWEEGLGGAAQANLQAAWGLVQELLRDIDVHRWEMALTACFCGCPLLSGPRTG